MSSQQMTPTLMRATTPPVTKKSNPIRTCVGCRQRHPTQVLMRIHLHEGSLVVDGEVSEVQSGGRGAWLCRGTVGSCLRDAVGSSAFDRAFRQRVPRAAIDQFTARFATPEVG